MYTYVYVYVYVYAYVYVYVYVYISMPFLEPLFSSRSSQVKVVFIASHTKQEDKQAWFKYNKYMLKKMDLFRT